jgi:hypothetical protein
VFVIAFEGAQQVQLGDDPDDLAARIENRQRIVVVGFEDRLELGERGLGPDGEWLLGHDVASLVVEKFVHGVDRP